MSNFFFCGKKDTKCMYIEYYPVLVLSFTITICASLLTSLIPAILFCNKSKKQFVSGQSTLLRIRFLVFISSIASHMLFCCVFCLLHSAMLYWMLLRSYLMLDSNIGGIPSAIQDQYGRTGIISVDVFLIATSIWNVGGLLLLELMQVI